MTVSKGTFQGSENSDAVVDLLARNRAKVYRTGEAIDALIAQHLNERRFFAALGEAMAELEFAGAGYQTYARVARCEMILGLNARARRSWTQALRFKETAQAYTGIGALNFQQGETNAAIAAFQKALSLEARNLGALESLSAAHLYLGEPLAARRYADLALQQDSERLESRLCRARAEIALGNHHSAARDVGLVRARGYKEHEVRLLEVDLLINDEEFESAMFLAGQLCEKYPESRECLNAFRRAYVAFDKGDRREDLVDFLGGLDHFAPLSKPHDPVASDVDETVDVIVPVHNAMHAVEACIASLKATSGPRLGRVILVNDASDKKVRDKLVALATDNERIVLAETAKRSGFSRALAVGVAESRAPAFVALNSDTIVTEGWLETLHAALRSEPQVAMVGPLSNNAGWQNYGPVLGQSGSFAGSQIPSSQCRADLEAEISGLKVKSFVPMHMLHGFCVLVDRKAYDAQGGLDQELFPEGYGEFQDLSIRMRGAGHDLFVVTDCVVFHERGASHSWTRRAALSLAGRKSLYARYSALNYLCLEMASVRTPALDDLRDDLRPVLDAWGIYANG
ncbi:glycosyltransferase [Yoonia sp. TsM2_T14_4]|uniref:glycosyltransferase n=1 Tax=Yoonia sp. TsM2_T14_4 TaxID=3415141 RepID=UPI003C75F1F7